MRASVCANSVLRDREHLLGVILADDVVVENFADLARRRDAVARLHQRGLVLLADDVHAQLDALVANEHGRPGDELAHLVLALTAERAVERILGIAAANLAHSCLHLPAEGSTSHLTKRRAKNP
jgi:hypothetical protein